MASGTKQLAADFEQVQNLLRRYPGIRIIGTEGNPPDCYDIEYHVKGYKRNNDGTAAPANRHKIRVTLPFGYPHFPPAVKPLTPIFHPDIDPDAIRIADFWQDNKSLAELIVHIGRMICGMSYQRAEPFNQEAFDWYEERRGWLPFDTLDPADTVDDGPAAGREAGAAAKINCSLEQPGDAPVEPAESVSPFDDASEDVDIDLFADDLESEEDDLPFALDFDEGDETGEPALDLFAEDQEIQADDLTATLRLEEEDAASPAADDDEEIIDLTADNEEELPGEEALEPEYPAGVRKDEETLFSLAGEEEIDDEMPLDLASEDTGNTSSGPDDISPEKAGTTLEMDAEPVSGVAAEKTVEEMSLAGLELEDDSQMNQETGSGSGKFRSIRPLIEQKKIFTAKKVLADVPDPSSIPDLEELEEQITYAVAKAENLYKKADRLEQAGEFEKAGLTLDLIANVAVDYPGLEFARNRIRDLLFSKDFGNEGPSRGDEGGDEKPQKKKKAKPGPAFKPPYRVIAVVGILIAILAAATMITIKDSKNIKSAYSNFQQAEQLLENKEFQEAEKALGEASASLDQIVALQRDEKEKLRQKIRTIIDSENFREGLQGRVLYNGKFVTVAMAKNIDKFNTLMVDAETRQNSGDIDEALEFYDQAGKIASQTGFEEQEKTIRQTMNSLQLKKALGEARKAEEEQEWAQAADTYAKALELSNSLSSSDDTDEIAKRFAAASFRHDLVEGQRAFTASEWQRTIEMLQRAEKILEANPQLASDSEKEEIHKLLIYSRLYHILSGARNAFEKKEWELAVNQYKNAVYLLEDNQRILGDKADISISKIEKTILMTKISREQNQNSLSVEEKDLPASLNGYRMIASLIENSSFRDDDTLRKIHDDAEKQIVTLENEIRINRRVDWLMQNYEEIFRTIYPSARSSELLNPQVTFVREEGDSLIFTMSCVEKRQGRSFGLELNYQYDQKKDGWSIYSGKL